MADFFFITKPLWVRVLTQHCADLIGQDGVCVVQPAASAQTLFEAVEDGLVGEKHHQDPQGCRDRARVKMFFHEHQEPIEAQGLHQILTCPAGGHKEQMSSSDDSQSAFLLKMQSNSFFLIFHHYFINLMTI